MLYVCEFRVCASDGFRVCFVCASFVFHVCFVCAYVAVSVCAFQWRSYYGLKYSTNLPIILVFKVCIFCRQRNAFITSIWNTHGVSWYTWCGFCKPVFSKRYAHIQVDSMNTASPLLYYLTVLTNRGILFSSCQKMNLPIQGFLDPPHATASHITHIRNWLTCISHI